MEHTGRLVCNASCCCLVRTARGSVSLPLFLHSSSSFSCFQKRRKAAAAALQSSIRRTQTEVPEVAASSRTTGPTLPCLFLHRLRRSLALPPRISRAPSPPHSASLCDVRLHRCFKAPRAAATSLPPLPVSLHPPSRPALPLLQARGHRARHPRRVPRGSQADGTARAATPGANEGGGRTQNAAEICHAQFHQQLRVDAIAVRTVDAVTYVDQAGSRLADRVPRISRHDGRRIFLSLAPHGAHPPSRSTPHCSWGRHHVLSLRAKNSSLAALVSLLLLLLFRCKN